MTWLQAVDEWAVAIVLSLVAAYIAWLISRVWKQAPSNGSFPRRVSTAVRKEPLSALTAGGIVVVTIVVIILARLMPSPSGPQAGSLSSPAPIATPSAEPAGSEIVEGGWGPARDLATEDSRPDAAMLNSVVDDPTVGDERGYMVIRPADDESGEWTNNVVVNPGKFFEVGIIINNDAKEGGDTATDVRLRVNMPGVVRTTTAVSEASLTASNVTPREIWDGITMVAHDAEEYAIRYVSGSAILHTGGDADGSVLSEDLFAEGVLVGCDSLDGALPAGARCQSWVTFRVKIDQPNFEIGAFAEGNGADAWSETHVATIGERVTIGVHYRNTGTTDQNGVVFVVDLPENMHYVKGSTVLTNSSNDGLRLDTDDVVGEEGINVGNYKPGANVFVTFEVILDSAPDGHPASQEISEFLVVHTNNGIKHAPLTFVWL